MIAVRNRNLRGFAAASCYISTRRFRYLATVREPLTFSIKYKLMLTLVATVVVVVGAMLFLTKWSFDRGFMSYVSSVEKEVHANLVHLLADEYSASGNWDFLRQHPQLWLEFNADSLSRAGVRRLHHLPPDIRSTPPPPPPGGPAARAWRPHRFKRFAMRPRTVLFDAQKNPIIGRHRPGEPLVYMPIDVNNKIVGYLGVRPRHQLFEARDLRFSRRLTRAFLYIALALAIAFAVIAVPVSRQLVRPIQELSRATRRLASGHYETRIAVAGNDELGQLARDFNSLSNTLERNEKSRRQWIADISHELRTPLAILQGEVEAVQDGVRECTPERLRQIHAETLNLSRLVNDLYELSMSDIGALTYEKRSLDIRDILESCLSSLRNAFSEKQITVEGPAKGGPIKMFGDPDRLKQMLVNVLNNSLRYTDSGGELRIDLGRRDGCIVLDIQDSAPGVGPDHVPHLFERFYRVDDSRSRATGGAGLGLAISRSIVEAHDGSISARDSELGGLWVRIELPGEA